MSVTAELKGYFSQLNGVEDQLKAVESQIEELLDKQQQLHTKKRHLEREIAKIQKGGSTSMGSNFSRKDFPWSKKLTEIRESVFKMTDFRPHQLETINATLSGRDVILIMPTGGGKSLCFQLPALVSKGITLVVSPLISLMEDQLMALEAFGINSTTLNASSSKEEKNSVHAAMLDAKSDLKILYVTPEKISKSKMFMSKLEKTHKAGRLSRIVIDEVHCCSQWGHDFRPDYKILGILKRQFPEVPLLGLTATATQHILEDVKNLLNVPYCTVLRASYDRPNLYYEVRRKPRKHEQFLEEVSNLLKGKFKGQSGIVYCFSKKEAEKVADDLKQRGIRALPYHADLDHKSRSYVHRQWTTGSIQAVVATVAFGMGIDKPDVRFVIHHTMSKSMENYYQESGRAGRDGKPAYCILYYGFSDIFRLSTMVFTETQVALENLYNMVRYCTDQQKCRRSLIARHFGESRDFTKCDRMCDRCSATEDGESCQVRDVTSQCNAIYSILEKTSRLDKKITANKLTDVLMKKGGTSSLQVKDLKLPPMTEEKYEMIVTHLLLECYLRQDFHFTPYSTISYIVPGSKEKLITAMGERVEVCLPSKSQKVSELPQLNVSRSKTLGSGKRKEISHSAASESSRVVRKKKEREGQGQSLKKKIIQMKDSPGLEVRLGLSREGTSPGEAQCIIISDDEDKKIESPQASKAGSSTDRNQDMSNLQRNPASSSQSPTKSLTAYLTKDMDRQISSSLCDNSSQASDREKKTISLEKKLPASKVRSKDLKRRSESSNPGSKNVKKLRTETSLGNSSSADLPEDLCSSDSDFESIQTVYTSQLRKLEEKERGFDRNVNDSFQVKERKRTDCNVIHSSKIKKRKRKKVDKEQSNAMDGPQQEQIKRDASREMKQKYVKSGCDRRVHDDVSSDDNDLKELETVYSEQLNQINHGSSD